MRASSIPLDTVTQHKFPGKAGSSLLFARGRFHERRILQTIRRPAGSSGVHLALFPKHLICWTWIRGETQWTGVFPKLSVCAARAGRQIELEGRVVTQARRERTEYRFTDGFMQDLQGEGVQCHHCRQSLRIVPVVMLHDQEEVKRFEAMRAEEHVPAQ